ncbi:MAG: S9 family peptidase, partial [Candidatus Kariarchaeaceae archaeon]
MKIFVIMILIISFLSSCTKDQSREVKNYSIDQFYENTKIGGGYFSVDEKSLLIRSNETGIYNVFALPVDGSAPQQLTHSEMESYFAISYVPDGNGFLYYADKGGDENDHLFWVNNEQKTTDLTPFEGSKSSFYGWSRDDKSFFYVSNKRNPKYFDLYEKEISYFHDTQAHRLIYQNDEGLDVGAIAKNKQYIALVKSITTNNNELYLYNIETKVKKHISPHTGDAQYNPQFFDLTNENLFFLTNENSEYMYLARYNLTSGKTEKVYETNWDIWYAYNSRNEKYRIIGINEDAK